MGKQLKKKTPEQKKKAREKALQKANSSSEAAGAKAPAARPSTSTTTAIVAKSAPVRGPKFWRSTVQFLREVRIELKKVTWPSRKQTVGSTIVVIVFVLVISSFLGISDSLLSLLVRTVLN